MQSRHLDAELPPVARMRHGDVPHVELDVDTVGFDPVGPVEG